MHGYASDNFFRGPKIYFGLGALAIAVASALHTFWQLPIAGWHVAVPAVSAGAIYAALIFLYEHFGWRWLSTLQDLNGTWVGEVTSTHNGGAKVACMMWVRQTWTRLAVELETEQSKSRSTMAALYEDSPGDAGLKYEYVSEPRNMAVQTMHVHRGVASLVIVGVEGGMRLQGNYFTGRGRETYGEVSLRRVSKSMLAFQEATRQE